MWVEAGDAAGFQLFVLTQQEINNTASQTRCGEILYVAPFILSSLSSQMIKHTAVQALSSDVAAVVVRWTLHLLLKLLC